MGDLSIFKVLSDSQRREILVLLKNGRLSAGEIAEKKVVTTTVNKVSRLIELDIDGEIIQCTETHPFQVKGKG